MAIISFLDPATVPFVSTFLFVFAVVFGLLTYAQIFTKKGDKPDRRVNAAIALAIGLFSTMYEPLVEMLTLYMPLAIGLLIILFFVALLQKMFGGKENESKDYFPLIVALGIMLFLLAMFSDRVLMFLPYGIDPNMVLWGIGIIAAVLFFWFIYKTKGE